MEASIDTSAPALKLCTDCQHIGTNASGTWETYRCFAPQNYSGVNLVTGHKEYKVKYCASHREVVALGDYNNTMYCGEVGQWFQKKLPMPAAEPSPVTISKRVVGIGSNNKGQSLEDLLGM